MKLHRWQEVPYTEAMDRMRQVHAEACRDGENHLIFCSHPPVFTVGTDTKRSWGVKAVPSDRGGSITCHSPGQAVSYFCFQVPQPARFYRNVLTAYEAFFTEVLPTVTYRKEAPGFYIENRKIASLGFRYARGVSLHGVALNVSVDLALHRQISPCGLEGIVATSLEAEGVAISVAEAENRLLACIAEAFDEDVET